MRKRYIIEVYFDENGIWSVANYPTGNNNARKMLGKPMLRRVHIYRERKKRMIKNAAK